MYSYILHCCIAVVMELLLFTMYIAGLRNTADSSLVDVTPLLSRQSSMSSVAAREPSIGDHVRQQRGVTRAILLWLGIGQWYCK